MYLTKMDFYLLFHCVNLQMSRTESELDLTVSKHDGYVNVVHVNTCFRS